MHPVSLRFGAIVIVLGLQAVNLFLAADRRNWTRAWAYLGICLVSILINGAIMLRTNPESIAERGRSKETKDWDKVVSVLWRLTQFLMLSLVAGLNVRFG
jgi:hypothetical protein